ncbi:exopolysaccharide biosynthesis polyprenyl glycosylphosphotransferase [Thalassospira lucentensis]|uniref:exopolysaccharide biosynthesis polyprenyl glycosylphosphotransferase n=1 Tax=Thalassospira lucentensis TaxID=168935 RepID=UPI0029421223|nr:exopolysaccharide biosynthesis polyprenyl glycosylphosphotransferase [Thalassospira lucentensis]WOI11245.1 exopolysaccharide biosynthesis polyprenyl glycosylphosphotransferase [Thalassospira lucentensis]
MAIGDIAVLLLAALFASWLRFDAILPPDHLLLPVFATPLFYLAAMMVLGGYYTLDPQTLQMGLLRVLGALAISFSLLLAIAYFSKVSDEFSRLWTAYFALAGLISIITLRLCSFGILRALGKQDIFRPTIAIIGSLPTPYIIETLESRVLAHRYRIIHRCLIRKDETTAAELQGCLAKLRRAGPDMIILALSETDKVRFANELDDIDAISSEILEIGDFSSRQPADTEGNATLDPGSEWIVMAGLPFIRRAIRPFGLRGWWIKRVEDIVIGSIAIIIAAPIMLVVAFLVKVTSPGPIFYIQLRHGFNGEPIRVLKFRSMYVDGCSARDASTVLQATRDDARITPFGAFIRKTSLDELPQLFNVLRGEMSLVGPRPHATQHNKHYRSRIDGYFARHRVKPGITGWAQVNGWRGETDTDEKMRQRILRDMFYISHWSIWFDIRILALTVIRTSFDKNAF